MVQRTFLYNIYTLYIYGYVHIPVIEGCIRVYKYHRGYNATIGWPVYSMESGSWKKYTVLTILEAAVRPALLRLIHNLRFLFYMYCR
jgi:hypothetical protein